MAVAESSQCIVSQLGQQILSGQLKPGERLAEVALSQQYQVSRAPIREALRQLAHLGLLTITPNVGASVRVFARHEIEALYEYRIALESEAARLAALRVDDEGALRLNSMLLQHEKIMSAPDSEGYARQQGDTDFHHLIAVLSNSAFIIETLTQELYPQLMLLRQQHKNVQGRGQVALQEHQRIVEAIQQHDAELAALLMRRHLQASWSALAGQLQH